MLNLLLLNLFAFVLVAKTNYTIANNNSLLIQLNTYHVILLKHKIYILYINCSTVTTIYHIIILTKIYVVFIFFLK